MSAVGFQVIGISTNQWDGQWMNRQHLMWAIKEHAPVLYVQEPEPWYLGRSPRDEHFATAGLEQKHPQLSVLRLPKMLCRRTVPGIWNRVVTRIKSHLTKRHVDDTKRRVVYFWHPQLWPYIDELAADISVFHVYDLLDEYHKPSHRDSSAYETFCHACKRADLVVTGTHQQAGIVNATRVAVVPNGVNAEWYSQHQPIPIDIADIPRPRIGYVGKISNKVDFGWLERLSSRREWHIVLVGPLQLAEPRTQRRFEQLCCQSNVHYLGSKAAEQVPAYIKSLDVGLMCYSRGLHCEGASPLKLFEYAAAGIPIVGSRLASLSGDSEIEDVAKLVDTAEEAFYAVGVAIANANDVAQRNRRIDFARRNSWAVRAESIMSLIASLRGH